MYADRVEAAEKRSVKERLNGSSVSDDSRRRTVAGKRRRQDDRWEHDLFEDDETHISNCKVDPRDLRLKLQRKNSQQRVRVGLKGLREKLSGMMNSQPINADPPKLKTAAANPARRSVAAEAREPVKKKVANVTSRNKSQQKADTSVDGFLQLLGLEKYIITFQAEEVDMTAFVLLTDKDLKALGMPMGPRKKIRLALESRE